MSSHDSRIIVSVHSPAVAAQYGGACTTAARRMSAAEIRITDGCALRADPVLVASVRAGAQSHIRRAARVYDARGVARKVERALSLVPRVLNDRR
jgi:hypothetical protein